MSFLPSFTYKMQKSLFILALWLTQALADTVNNIVVFGDSYSDTGNHQRLTNGPLWNENLAVGWNASLYNFAFSGAVCNNTMYEKEDTVHYIPSIVDQVEMYYKQNLKLNPEETVIIFWVGVNDIHKIFEKNKDDRTKIDSDLKSVADCIGSNLRTVRKVFSTNKFIVFGVPPLERMPFYAGSYLESSRETAANQLNEYLTKDTEKMNKHLQSLELDLVDIHKLLDDISDTPDNFGIKNAIEPYWDACQGKCTDDIDSYVWWDKTHLTGGIHRLVSSSILLAGSHAPATELGPSEDVVLALEEKDSPYRSPIYKAKKNTGELARVAAKLDTEKKAASEEVEEKELGSEEEGRPSRNYLVFGIFATGAVCIGFVLFSKSRKRGSNLSALSSLVKNKNRGQFVPLRNMDSEV
ncbi:carbohydrate esterase family 16 protein, partial [Backusella circina FSU 941]